MITNDLPISRLPIRTDDEKDDSNLIEVTVGNVGNYKSTKTTVADFSRQLLAGSDFDCSVISNVSAIHNSVSCIDTIHFNTNIHVDTASAMIIPVGDSSTRSPEMTGAIRYNTDIHSFEGYHGNYWSGLGGGFTIVDEFRQVQGTSRAMIGPSSAEIFEPFQEHDIWIDTVNNVVKRYVEGSTNDWVICGAAYL